MLLGWVTKRNMRIIAQPGAAELLQVRRGRRRSCSFKSKASPAAVVLKSWLSAGSTAGGGRRCPVPVDVSSRLCRRCPCGCRSLAQRSRFLSRSLSRHFHPLSLTGQGEDAIRGHFGFTKLYSSTSQLGALQPRIAFHRQQLRPQDLGQLRALWQRHTQLSQCQRRNYHCNLHEKRSSQRYPFLLRFFMWYFRNHIHRSMNSVTLILWIFHWGWTQHKVDWQMEAKQIPVFYKLWTLYHITSASKGWLMTLAFLNFAILPCSDMRHCRSCDKCPKFWPFNLIKLWPVHLSFSCVI